MPEGVANRILKHRVKVTGSHIGTGKYKTGGVNHTKHWRDYAVLRAQFYLNKQVPDQCSDARLIIGKLVSPEPHLTKKLEYFEHLIFKNVDGIRDDIYKLLWSDNEPSLVTLLTYRSSERDSPADPEIELWDNKVHRFLDVSLAV